MNAIKTLMARIRKDHDGTASGQDGGRARRLGQTRQLSVEKMEDRKLMTAWISFNAFNGVVTVQGTRAAETVLMTTQNNQLTVSATSSDGTPTAIRVYNAANVRGITVYGGDGDDRVINGTSLTMVAYGQNGQDFVIGGTGVDGIDGGNGNDLIDGRAGNDVLLGGSGDDLVLGNSGDDTIGGGDGNDLLHGGEGDDRVYGHAGNDILAGGSGYDRLTDTLGSNRFLDSGMLWGRWLGQYRGSYLDSYEEGHPIRANLQMSDVLQSPSRQPSTLFTGNGDVIDWMTENGWSSSPSENIRRSLLLEDNPGTTAYTETLNQLYP